MKELWSQLLRDFPRAPELVWRDVEANTRRLVEWAAARGKLSAEDARQVLAELAQAPAAAAQSLEDSLDRFIKAHISELRFPQREELTALRQRINRLIDRADQLEAALQARRKPAETHRD